MGKNGIRQDKSTVGEIALANALANDQIQIIEYRTPKRPARVPPSAQPSTRRSEAQEQADLFTWADARLDLYPELADMYAIPNGEYRPKKTGARLKAQGVRAGTPDICLPTPAGRYHGMYIEMKAGKNKLSILQKERIERLRNQGYYVVVCYSKQAAANEIVWYLRGQFEQV